MEAVSVIIIAKNEEQRIGRALDCVLAWNPAELIVVDGLSHDRTVEIARAKGAQVLTGGRGVAGDRQIGIDAAKHDLICLIDADHRPTPDDLGKLLRDMDEFQFDAVQAQVAIEETGFWTRAENEAFEVFHHVPGPRSMMGTAPALYRKSVFEIARFDEQRPGVSDDADLFYRLHKSGLAWFGIGRTKIYQEHHANAADYYAKFKFYGRRDAGFCLKHPQRAWSMFLHLMVTYPILRPARALARGKWRGALYLWFCGGVRLSAMFGRLLGEAFKPKSRASETAAA
ncbi:MAG: glycosyltransferase family 2 protein [Caulobacterales bacterium]